MKKAKQFILILLGVTVALAVAAVLLLNHFSFFKYADTPEIVSVEIVDQNPLSMKAFRNRMEEKERFLKASGEELQPQHYEINLNEIPVYHEFKVTLSDGRTVNVSNLNNIADVDAATSVSVQAYVKYGECLAVEKNPSPTVTVYLRATVYIGEYKEEEKSYYFEVSKPLVASYLQSFTAYIRADKTLVIDSDDYKFNEDLFEIVYADGTSKTVQPVRDEDAPIYRIDGHPVTTYGSLFVGDGQDYICYLDERYPINTDKYDFIDPVFSAKITSYTFDEKGLVDVVNVDITKEDGTVIPVSVPVEKKGIEIMSTYETVGDCTIRIVVEYDGVTNPFKKDMIYITVSDGFSAMDTVSAQAPDSLSFFSALDLSLVGAEFFAELHGFDD